MEEKELNHEESLQLIQSMINNAKSYYYESGLGALLWGFTNVICFLLAYFDATSDKFAMPFSPFLLMIVTVVLQFYFDRKESRYKTATTYIDEVNKYVWQAFGIGVLVFTIGGAFANIGYIVLPVLLLMFGIPTYITGRMNKFFPFIAGGIFCWILCLVALFYKSYNTYLLVAAGALVAWVIPGFILRYRFHKKNTNGI